MSAFWYLYSNKRLDDALYLVQQFGANINHIDNYGTFALKRELFDNNLQGFTRLLDQGQANPDMRDEFQRSCLHLACDFAHRRDYTEFFKALMKHSADLAALDFKQRIPLRYLYIKKNKRHEIDEFDPLPTLKLLLTQATSGKFSPALQDIHG
jgi:ankyrin repeat protein